MGEKCGSCEISVAAAELIRAYGKNKDYDTLAEQFVEENMTLQDLASALGAPGEFLERFKAMGVPTDKTLRQVLCEEEGKGSPACEIPPKKTP